MQYVKFKKYNSTNVRFYDILFRVTGGPPMLHLLSRSFFLLTLFIAVTALAEDVHLDSCDGLPLVEVSVPGVKAKMRFLVDTAATSILNSKSFSSGSPNKIAVTSWRGTVETRASAVTITELIIGQHHLKDLHLPAVDLSAIGNTCGKRIDGILGVDLLSRLAATVDLKEHTAHLAPDATTSESSLLELHQQLSNCEDAFNRADEHAFGECLDPDVITFTPAGDFYGRAANLSYYRTTYFQQTPPAQLSTIPRAHHLIGDAAWVEYDLKIVVGEHVMVARGTALCHRKNGAWRIVHLNHSAPAQ
jgi:ketosteroid isomerase-like protein